MHASPQVVLVSQTSGCRFVEETAIVHEGKI